MFSGIIESQGRVLQCQEDTNSLCLTLKKPSDFNDINLGDSIACDGICLTVETFNEEQMQFTLGAETLQITGWNKTVLQNRSMNLERSLRFGDRLHGHLVSGHVDAMGQVKKVEDLGASRTLNIEFPQKLAPYIWKKGSCAINGVSLTINTVENSVLSVCLIPETLSRTNLSLLKIGDKVSLEIDMLARGLVHVLQTQREVGATP